GLPTFFRSSSSFRSTLLPIAMMLSLIAPLPAIAQEQLLKTLTVSGQGVKNIPTTLATINLGVEVQGKTADGVQKEVARRSNAVVAFLKLRQVDKLQTTGISLNAEYQYTDNKQTLVGYQGRNTVSFQTSIDKAGVLMDEAVKTGASRIDGVSFMATEAAIASAQQDALRSATQEAQTQAKVVLDALGFTAKEIVSIQVNGASPPVLERQQFSRDTKLQGEAVMAPQPVIGGEQEVRSAVTLQISY
ncbi:MAG: SIMPL domain-containing protein, partial [Thermosynechococcaceae cyanobacterium]